MSNTLAETLEFNLNRNVKYRSKSGAPLLFDDAYISDRYAELFGISEPELFYTAFKQVTEGEGNELAKINSVASSSLLSLLVFFPIYKGEKITLKICDKETTFDKCFFEVQNKVIRRPSSVDVVLISQDRKTVLFLESKLSEFEEVTNANLYGSGYFELYNSFLSEFLDGVSLKVEKTTKFGKTKMKISSANEDDKLYIEGIKQSISHLIGIIKGPQSNEESSEYEDIYKNADVFIYGTILFDPINLGTDIAPFEQYKANYETFSANCQAICQRIKEWAKYPKCSEDKEIVVLDKVLTYQSLPEEYRRRLPDKVRTFYNI